MQYLILQSIYDQNQVKLKIRAKQLSQLPKVRQNQVILVQGAQRGISKHMEIFIQLEYKQHKDHIKVLGAINKLSYSGLKLDKAYSKVLISDIPSSSIVRNILKFNLMIIDIQYMRIAMKNWVQGDNSAGQYPSILVLAVVQDGSAKATLRLEDGIAMKAFNLS